MTLNDRIRLLCKERQVKQITIARKLKISSSHMSQIIHGSRPVKAEYLPEIASCLGLTIENLFGIGSGQSLSDYTMIIVETDEENPVPIARISPDGIDVANGYRVRAKPFFND